MTLQDKDALSREELGEQFDLLVADAREYALFLVAPDGRILCWNPGAERLFGYQSNEVVGEHFSRFFSADDIRSGQPEQELKAAHAEGRTDAVRWQVRKDGTRFWCTTTVRPLFDATKQVRSFARVMYDLTDSQAQAAQKKRGRVRVSEVASNRSTTTGDIKQTTHDVLDSLAQEPGRSIAECCVHFVQYIKARQFCDLPDERTRMSLDALEALAPHQMELWTRSDEAIPLCEPAKKYAAFMRDTTERLPTLG